LWWSEAPSAGKPREKHDHALGLVRSGIVDYKLLNHSPGNVREKKGTDFPGG